MLVELDFLEIGLYDEQKTPGLAFHPMQVSSWLVVCVSIGAVVGVSEMLMIHWHNNSIIRDHMLKNAIGLILPAIVTFQCLPLSEYTTLSLSTPIRIYHYCHPDHINYCHSDEIKYIHLILRI